MKYENLRTGYRLHQGSLKRCWHLNAKQPGDVRIGPASGLSQGQGAGQGSSLVSNLIRGLLPARIKASEVSTEHTQPH